MLAGCPLIIVGVTGPLLLYDEVSVLGPYTRRIDL